MIFEKKWGNKTNAFFLNALHYTHIYNLSKNFIKIHELKL